MVHSTIFIIWYNEQIDKTFTAKEYLNAGETVSFTHCWIDIQNRNWTQELRDNTIKEATRNTAEQAEIQEIKRTKDFDLIVKETNINVLGRSYK